MRAISLSRFATACLLALGLLPLSMVSGASPIASAQAADFCSRLGHSIDASAGAHAACNLKMGVTPQAGTLKKSLAGMAGTCPNVPGAPRRFGNNVDAADPHEDQTPACLQLYGQSEVSIAAVNQYVVEAWNDATALSSPCGSPMYKDQGIGYGFSADHGASFTDQGGLPNDACPDPRWIADPSVEAWQSGQSSYFYISGLYVSFHPNPFGPPTIFSNVAMTACKASGSGSTAAIACSPKPVIIANGIASGDFLDKPFLAIDAARNRLYATYTRFGGPGSASFNGQIELAMCDISDPIHPQCFPGDSPSPYLVVAPGALCENQGAYPAVHQATGDVYVAWEYNWATNAFFPPCFGQPTLNKVAYVPHTCLTPTPVSACGTTPLTRSVPIVSMAVAFVPGYNRMPIGDWPRIAVSDPYRTVSIVWNDARMHPTGDIYLQSFELATLAPVQGTPVRLNSDSSYTWKIFPALRYPTSEGKLDVSWYDRRREANPEQRDAYTDVYAALDINPRTGPGEEESGRSNVRVTNQASNWFATSSNHGPQSDMLANFGDYTDNYVLRTAAGPTYTDAQLHIAWSDGRMGLPQPFTTRIGRGGEVD